MPTDRSREVYDFLGAYIARHGRAPKLREIADHLGIRSRGVVHRYLSALRDEGLIAVEPDVARGVRLLYEARDAQGRASAAIGRMPRAAGGDPPRPKARGGAGRTTPPPLLR